MASTVASTVSSIAAPAVSASTPKPARHATAAARSSSCPAPGTASAASSERMPSPRRPRRNQYQVSALTSRNACPVVSALSSAARRLAVSASRRSSQTRWSLPRSAATDCSASKR
jgi:hypothetical protein